MDTIQHMTHVASIQDIGILGLKCAFKHQDLLMFGLKYDYNFQPLEVVVRGSETQLQLAENLNNLI